MIVKVCGLREPENIRAVEQAGADLLGFIFYPPSPRYSTEPAVCMCRARRRVGVFVSPTLQEIMRCVYRFGLHGIQLHGEASPELCHALWAEGLTVIRALPATGDLDKATRPYEGLADFFLFDTPTEKHGGSGVSFNWEVLHGYTGRTPFLLSGGLCPESLPALAEFSHPAWAGIDLNSGFETEPGLKDPALLADFITAFRKLKETGKDAKPQPAPATRRTTSILHPQPSNTHPA